MTIKWVDTARPLKCLPTLTFCSEGVRRLLRRSDHTCRSCRNSKTSSMRFSSRITKERPRIATIDRANTRRSHGTARRHHHRYLTTTGLLPASSLSIIPATHQRYRHQQEPIIRFVFSLYLPTIYNKSTDFSTDLQTYLHHHHHNQSRAQSPEAKVSASLNRAFRYVCACSSQSVSLSV